MALKRLIIFLILIVVLLLIGYYYPYLTGEAVDNIGEKIISEKETGLVTRVVDGDTIHVNVNGKDETVRILGINTPEKKKPYYNEAKSFLIASIENKSVELVIDGDDLDRYNRQLRYVFLNERLINVEIVENGFATTFMLDNLKYKDKFVNGENFARTHEKGLWKKSNDKCANCIILVRLNATIDYFIIKNKCDFYCNLSNWLVKDDANHFFQLNDLNSNEEKKYDSIQIFKAEVWNDAGDRFFMRDENGDLVIFYSYP